MLSCRVVTNILMLSLGSLITGQHSQFRTNDGTENGRGALKNHSIWHVFLLINFLNQYFQLLVKWNATDIINYGDDGMVATHLRIVRQNVNRILLVIISVNYRQIGYDTYSQQNQKSDRCDLILLEINAQYKTTHYSTK